MRKIYAITALILLVSTTTSFAQYGEESSIIKRTQIYSGDQTTAQFNEKIAVIDQEIEKVEAKKAAELKALGKEYKSNMPQAPKVKKVEAKKAPKKTNPYSLSEALQEKTDTVTETATVAETNNYTEIKAEYDAQYRADKKAIEAKYDVLITKLTEQKLAVTNAMVNSKGNYVASNSNSRDAAHLYTAIKYADNIGNTNSANTVQNGQTVMLFISNRSTHTVTITSAPFAGITLAPGERSQVAYPVSVGVYSLTYTQYYSGSNVATSKTMNIGISRETTANAIIISDRF